MIYDGGAMGEIAIPKIASIPKPRIPWAAAIFVLAVGLVNLCTPSKMTLYSGWVLEFGIDWHIAYRPALDNLFAGLSPYDIGPSPYLFLNPPWALLPLIPLSILPDRLAISALAVINLCSFAYVSNRLSGSLTAALLLLLAPPILLVSLAGNIDGIAALGLIMPPQIGLFFISLKPQGLGFIALVWLAQSWQKGGPQETIRVFLPFGAAFVISLFLFGLWPLAVLKASAITYNISPWPYAIPVGLVLLVKAFHQGKNHHAILAAPFLSPYLHSLSFALPLLGLVKDKRALLAAVLGLWLVVVLLSL
jgi:hypothetical protein